MTDPVDGGARPGPGFAGIALAVLSAGTFGMSGIFAPALISAGWSPAAAAMARLGGGAILLAVPISWIVPVLELSLVSAVIAYVAGIAAARRLGARLASFAGMAEVFFAVLYAWLLLGQTPSALDFSGGAFMLGGVILVRIDETKRSAERISGPAGG